jgi:hypothetical protein
MLPFYGSRTAVMYTSIVYAGHGGVMITRQYLVETSSSCTRFEDPHTFCHAIKPELRMWSSEQQLTPKKFQTALIVGRCVA